MLRWPLRFAALALVSAAQSAAPIPISKLSLAERQQNCQVQPPYPWRIERQLYHGSDQAGTDGWSGSRSPGASRARARFHVRSDAAVRHTCLSWAYALMWSPSRPVPAFATVFIPSSIFVGRAIMKSWMKLVATSVLAISATARNSSRVRSSDI